jgi:5-histidylcysteine sulfoxide synthase
MPALTISDSGSFPSKEFPELKNEVRKTMIGSFRDNVDVKSLLPPDLYSAIFDPIPDDWSLNSLITIKKNQGKHYLNNAAFGRAYDEVLKLNSRLREFSESHPDIFYDQACMPLIKYTYKVLEEFFQTDLMVLVPNCTFGLKSVMDHLVKDRKHRVIAQLAPIYGATQKLLECYQATGSIDKVVKISPGRGHSALLEEDPTVILEALEDAWALQEFSVLFCDQVASQTGRILPLEAVTKFCRDNNVVLVVDGTQSCQLFFGKNKNQIKNVDFFVMSTHKWISNVKTCGVVVFKDVGSHPEPPAISFGWSRSKAASVGQIREMFQWQGMLDSYISYITLSKAIKIFSKYGEAQLMMASGVLQQGISDVLHRQPMLPKTFYSRNINILELESSQFESMGDITSIQNAFQDYGIYISVKKYGKGCVEITDNMADFNAGVSCEITATKGKCRRPSKGDKNCAQTKGKFYIRISCWSYNTAEDFEALNLVFNNNLALSTSCSSSLIHQFLHTFNLYEKLFSTLDPKAFFIRAERLRHHLIFYYAHTAVFFINKLVLSKYLSPLQRIDPELESTMSVGVDEMSWDDLLEDNYEWSSLSDDDKVLYLLRIRNYRQKVKDLILDMLKEHPVSNPIRQESFHWVILMGMEHEKIHLETSAVIISQVPIELIKRNHDFNFKAYYDENMYADCPADAPSNTLVRIPGGEVRMGKDFHEHDLYGWDNEFGNERQELKTFTASQMLVSNAEYLEFVLAGGYQQEGRLWWSEEGWKYVTDLQVTGPRFWIGQTHYRMMLDIIPMPWDFPVEVNNLEAEAFCNWKSGQVGKQLRLISHEESFHMRQIAKKQTSNCNMNKYASPTPVNMCGGFINGKKVFDISGNVWRHSVSVLTIMEGFKMDPFYNDFTLPTIDGFHNHILGGSWISLGNCSNLNARYGFRRHFYQYAGIRYVSSENKYHDKVMRIFDGVTIGRQITEHFTHFKDNVFIQKKPVENWPERLGQMAAEQINNEAPGARGKLKVLVAYGGTGRLALEILRGCQDVDIDYTDSTANNLQVLEQLLENRKIQWYQVVEGKLSELLEYKLTEYETKDRLLKEKENTIAYWQADYKNLRPFLTGYNVVVVDFRQKDIIFELRHIAGKLLDGGLLILGNINKMDGDTSTGRCSPILQSQTRVFLEKWFDEIRCDDAMESYAHIYKETRNKHQYAVSTFSVWRKRREEGNLEDDDIGDYGDIYKSPETTADYYEDNDILRSYDTFHFGDGLLGVANFPKKMAEVCLEACKKFGVKLDSALDAGCGPGGTALELCKSFGKVEAYDYSQSFVDMMKEQQERRHLTNLTCYQGDSHVQSSLTEDKFDLIFGCNLIDRLHTPSAWITQSKEMLRTGGLLIVSSPYTWRPEHTAVENWVGGYLKDGENYFTIDGLKEALLPDLVLLEERKVPFVIPDADGTFQYTYSNCTVFGSQR